MTFFQFGYTGLLAVWTIIIISGGQKLIREFFNLQNHKKDKMFDKVTTLLGNHFGNEMKEQHKIAMGHRKRMIQNNAIVWFVQIFLLTFFISVTRNVLIDVNPLNLLVTFIILSIILPLFMFTLGSHINHNKHVEDSEQFSKPMEDSEAEVNVVHGKGLESLMKDLFPEDEAEEVTEDKDCDKVEIQNKEEEKVD